MYSSKPAQARLLLRGAWGIMLLMRKVASFALVLLVRSAEGQL